MDLIIEIKKEHSKANTIRIAKLIESDPGLFTQLMHIYFNENDMDTARKAAWIMRECVMVNPQILDSFQGKIIQYLQSENLHDAIKRNALVLLKDRNYSTKQSGVLLEICFRYLQSASEPTAVKAHAMDIIFEMGKDHPDINHELKLILEDLIPYSTSGLKNKAEKILKNIR